MAQHRRQPASRFAALAASRPARLFSTRLRLVALAAALLATTGGTAVALASGDQWPEAPAAVRQDDRASRGLQRPLVTATLAATATPTPTPSASASTSATTAPTRAPAPKVTTRPPTATVVIPASCAGYQGSRAIACALLPSFGYSVSQMPSLDKLWERESGWNYQAANSSSGAYGIPQALPGSKMGTVASDWRTNPATQIKWGLGYIKDRYGSPSAAWSFWLSHNWY